MTDLSPQPSGPFAQGATLAAQLLAQTRPDPNQAAQVLLGQCGGRLSAYIKKESFRQASDEDVEELLTDTIMAFLQSQPPPECQAAVWLYSIARSKVLDWARRRAAEKRGGKTQMEVALDDEEIGRLLDTSYGHTEIPPWVRDCVQKAATVMEQENPNRAMVLFMVVEKWSAEEIAIYFGADPNKLTEPNHAAARDRVYRATKLAQSYFEHCKE